MTNPIAVYSADDHDYCEITHHTAEASIPETTCKTFSTSMGVDRPGYQLLSLLNPLESAAARGITQKSRLCLLPDQRALYTRFCRLISLPHGDSLAD